MMGPIYAFMLLAVLIGGSALATDKANGDELPSEVKLIHTEIDTYRVESSIFKEYLRRPPWEHWVPTTIAFRIDCYSDGSGQVLEVKNFSSFNRSLTSKGSDLLRVVIQDIGYHTCTTIWENLYEKLDAGESVGPWYF